MSKDTSGPAFPLPPLGEGNYPDWQGSGGLSVRDYFAAAALPACIQTCANDSGSAEKESYFAMRAYMCADAMLAERDK
ncbi:MAG: hypothetical protein KGJ13_09650 [Patescibacteria group bacterium]|nr:hypothetical protein [Patescibacteria group bacterium]